MENTLKILCFIIMDSKWKKDNIIRVLTRTEQNKERSVVWHAYAVCTTSDEGIGSPHRQTLALELL